MSRRMDPAQLRSLRDVWLSMVCRRNAVIDFSQEPTPAAACASMKVPPLPTRLVSSSQRLGNEQVNTVCNSAVPWVFMYHVQHDGSRRVSSAWPVVALMTFASLSHFEGHR
jgi:hypothetical protein